MSLIQFFVAGFETTYTALNYCFYALTKYPEETKKLQDEIDSKFDYDDVKFFLLNHRFCN
jgi:cytochrome P450